MSLKSSPSESPAKKKKLAKDVFLGLLFGIGLLGVDMGLNRDKIKQVLAPVPSSKIPKIAKTPQLLPPPAIPNSPGILRTYDDGSQNGRLLEHSTIRSLVNCVLEKAKEDQKDVLCSTNGFESICKVLPGDEEAFEDDSVGLGVSMRLYDVDGDSESLHVFISPDTDPFIMNDAALLIPGQMFLEDPEQFQQIDYPITGESGPRAMNSDDQEELCQTYYDAISSAKSADELFRPYNTPDELRDFLLAEVPDQYLQPGAKNWLQDLDEESMKRYLDEWNRSEDTILNAAENDLEQIQALDQLQRGLSSSGVTMDLASFGNEGQVGTGTPVYVSPVGDDIYHYPEGDWVYKGTDPSGNIMCWGDLSEIAQCLQMFD
jgi:hypothetical protein